MAVLHCVTSFEGTSYKKLHDTATGPFILVVLHQLLHRHIDFLQHFRTLFTIIRKSIFVINFPYLARINKNL